MIKFLLLIALFLIQGLAFSKEDRAIVKIQKRAIFSSDFNILLKDIKTFGCLGSKSKLIANLDLLSEKKVSTKIPKLRDNKDFILDLVKLMKLQMLSNSGNTSYDAVDVEKLTSSGCFAFEPKKWSSGLRSLIQTELYLRFRLNKEKISAKEIISKTNKRIGHALLF